MSLHFPFPFCMCTIGHLFNVYLNEQKSQNNRVRQALMTFREFNIEQNERLAISLSSL